MDELTHIRQAREGDPEAFRALFDGHRERIYGLAYRYLRNRTDAEDVLQETFIKAYNALPGYDPAKGLNFAAWINRICVNASIDAMRRSRTRDAGPLGPEEAAAMPATSHASDPERSARSAEIREKIDQALTRLTPPNGWSSLSAITRNSPPGRSPKPCAPPREASRNTCSGPSP